MKKIMMSMLVLSTLAGAAQAADRQLMLPIAAAMEAPEAQSKLDGKVRLFFGNQTTPKVLEKLGVDKTSQKTNAFGKSDEKACNWVFLSAMMSLQKRAQALGANAVINIVSNYKNVENSNPTTFECHAGAIMAGAAFKGDFVRIADQ